MASNLATPGVYVEEKSSFGTSVVPVPTAIPAFIGYTGKALRGTKSLLNVPTRISSFGEFVELFGGAPKTLFSISPLSSGAPQPKADDKAPKPAKGNAATSEYSLQMDLATRYLLYDSLRLFFVNGGSDCYIVSVGSYSDKITAKDLNDVAVGGGLSALEKYIEPTIVVIPEAVLLNEAECFATQAAMLMHCGYKMQNRFAILDVFNGNTERTFDNKDVVNKFREGVGSNFLAWGAAYYPYINTTIVGSSEIDYTRVSNSSGLIIF